MQLKAQDIRLPGLFPSCQPAVGVRCPGEPTMCQRSCEAAKSGIRSRGMDASLPRSVMVTLLSQLLQSSGDTEME